MTCALRVIHLHFFDLQKIVSLPLDITKPLFRQDAQDSFVPSRAKTGIMCSSKDSTLIMSTVASSREAVETPYAWARLVVSLLLMTLGGSGMYSVTVVLPQIQAEFNISRSDASLPYTLTMLGFGLGGILMGRLSDRFGVIVP